MSYRLLYTDKAVRQLGELPVEFVENVEKQLLALADSLSHWASLSRRRRFPRAANFTISNSSIRLPICGFLPSSFATLRMKRLSTF
ncbi:MAG TPA: hypothetical protein VN641_03825 [Urbifossiella sp.]|nr:hypothetical protein [Urbifossiella sp.]